jgi:DNA-binding MarR family transcriptional regulator
MQLDNPKINILTKIFLLSNTLQMEGDKLSDELTLKQWFLLMFLYKSKMQNPSMNDLALKMGVTRQSMKKMVAVLEKSNYLSVEKSSLDSRALCIRPTEKAYQFFQQNKQLGKTLVKKVFSHVDEEELNIAVKVLQQMQKNLQDEVK